MKAIMKIAMAFAVVATLSFVSCNSNSASGSASGEGSEEKAMTPVEAALDLFKTTTTKIEAATSLDELQKIYNEAGETAAQMEKGWSKEDAESVYNSEEVKEANAKMQQVYTKKVVELGGSDDFSFDEEEYASYDGGEELDFSEYEGMVSEGVDELQGNLEDALESYSF